MTRPFVRAGDAKRRKAEDALFASDPKKHAEAGELLKAARKDYTDAATVAQAARAAFDVRDTVLADLPFLSRWYAERYASAKEAADLIDLWDKVHALAFELDELTAKPPDVERARTVAKTAAGIGERYAKLLADFRAEADRARGDAALQAEWWAKQQLLSVPLIAAEKRAAVLAASRHASGSLLADPNQARKATPEAAKDDAKKAAEVRGKLARAALGGRLLDAQHEADKALPKADFLDRDLTAIATTDQWTGHAAQVGAGLAGHFARLSADGAAPSPEPDLRAERVSRTAIPFDAVAGWEPAAANHRLRWRAYLTDLAERTADDHWYDEKQQSPVPYFQAVAKRYLADADRITAGLIAGTPPGAKGTWDAQPPASLAAKLDAPALTARDLDSDHLDERVGPDHPVRPRPAAERLPRDRGRGRGRPLRRCRPDPPDRRGPGPAAAADPGRLARAGRRAAARRRRPEEITKTGGRAACTVYFRGQRPTQQRHDRPAPQARAGDRRPAAGRQGPRQLRRRPGRPQPGTRVGGDPARLLREHEWASEGPPPGQNWQTGPRGSTSRCGAGALLQELPEGHAAADPGVLRQAERPRGSRVVFGTGEGDDRPEVTWDGPGRPRLRGLWSPHSRDHRPGGRDPAGASRSPTPPQTDFADLPAGSRTLLVLTDGAEDDRPTQAGPAAGGLHRRPRPSRWPTDFKGLGRVRPRRPVRPQGRREGGLRRLFEPL